MVLHVVAGISVLLQKQGPDGTCRQVLREYAIMGRWCPLSFERVLKGSESRFKDQSQGGVSLKKKEALKAILDEHGIRVGTATTFTTGDVPRGVSCDHVMTQLGEGTNGSYKYKIPSSLPVTISRCRTDPGFVLLNDLPSGAMLVWPRSLLSRVKLTVEIRVRVGCAAYCFDLIIALPMIMGPLKVLNIKRLKLFLNSACHVEVHLSHDYFNNDS